MATLTLLGRHDPRDLVATGDGGSRTAGELRDDIAAVAARLPPPAAGRPLVLICADRYHFAVGLLAAWQAGHPVALPPNGQPATVDTIVRRTGALALVHDTEAPGGIELRAILGDSRRGRAPAISAQRPNSRPLIPATGPAITAFTSGSSGDFQACAKTAAQLMGEVTCLAQTFGVSPSDRLLATVPPHHLYGLLFTVLLPLASGAAFSRDTPLHAETIAARVAAMGASLLVSVPAHVRALTLLEAGQLHGIRRLFCSTAPLPATTAAAVRALHQLAVTEVFGSTETGGIAWRSGADRPAWRPFSVVSVTADETGRLHIDSPFIAPDAPRPLATEDRICLDDTGGFQHLGRMDAVVKVAGKRLSLDHLRVQILALPGVTDAEVVATPVDGARDVHVWAAVAGEGLSQRAVRDGLRPWFESAQLPRRICITTALPREATGKITRERLLALFTAQRAGTLQDAQTVAPTPARPRTIEVLSHRRGPDDDGVHVFQLAVPPDFAWFEGHFPTQPILPGIATLHDVVLAQVLRVSPNLGQPSGVARLKFRRLVAPGAQLRLTLTFKGTARVDFSVDEDGETCASGRLTFGGFA